MGAAVLARRRVADRAWRSALRIVAVLIGAHLRRGRPSVAVYLAGSVAAGDAVCGLSDLDLVVVVPDHPTRPGENRAQVVGRWKALERRLPRLGRGVDLLAYEAAQLERAVWAPCLSDPPHAGRSRRWRARASRHGGRSLLDRGELCVRPGLYGPMRDWSLLTGSEGRPAAPPRDRSQEWVAAWHELQYWWRQAFRAVFEPQARDLPLLCLKLTAEPARVWLWIAHGEHVHTRSAVLDRSLELLPEAEELLGPAVALERRMSGAAREAGLATSLASLTAFSARLGRRLVEELAPHGATPVSLCGVAPAAAAGLLPLLDWRARAVPPAREEAFVVRPGHPADAAALRTAAAGASACLYPTLRRDGLMVMPVRDLTESKLRGVQCPVTDPVSFALADGANVAAFPNVPGWSALDSGRRAVAEHAGWLGIDPDARGPAAATRPPSAHRELGVLLTAIRAAVFLGSTQAGAPELGLTLEAVVEGAAAHAPALGDLAAEAVPVWRAGPGAGEPAARRLLPGLRERVGALEPFRRIAASA